MDQSFTDLASALTVFFRNHVELDVILEFHSDAKRQRQSFFRRDPSDYPHDVRQRLYNWLAASSSLVAVSRRTARRVFSGTNFEAEYQARIQRMFAASEVVQFVHGLRNFAFHHAIPLASTIMESGGGKLWSGACLQVSSLSAWSGWNAPARRYLSACSGDWLEIRPFTSHYTDIAREFYDWLASRQDQLSSAQEEWLEARKDFVRLGLLSERSG